MQIDFRVQEKDEGAKLGVFLRRQAVSVSLLRRLKYEQQGILLNGERARTNLRISAGDLVSIRLPADEMPATCPQDIPLECLYESEHALVVNKPAGLVMHPTLSHKEGTMANAFAALMRQREEVRAFRPVGRLDGNTSGLVLCAMNAYAAPVLAESLQKRYLALVQGCIQGDEGVVEAPLAPAPDSAILQEVSEEGKYSCTAWQVLHKNPRWSLLGVWPKTGRTHQIRVHMAHIGHPLLGDELYGGEKLEITRHALHCAVISFRQPGSHETHWFTQNLPPDMQTVLESEQAGGLDPAELAKQWL